MTLLFNIMAMAAAMVATIAAPRAARSDALLGAVITDRNVRVVHLGQSAIVLSRETFSPHCAAGFDILLTITDAAGGVTPGGVSVIDAADFARLRADVANAGIGAWVDVSRWSHDTDVTSVDLCLTAPDLDNAVTLAVTRATTRAVSHALAVMTSREPMAQAPVTEVHSTEAPFDGGLARVRSRAVDLAVAALSLNPAPVLTDIIGAGPGTTPTGDDMVVGCLAALSILGHTAAATRLAQATAPLLHATTTTSRHYLAAAASGRFAEHVHHLIAGFSAGISADRMLTHAHRWGATSGVDLLIGITATLRVDLAARAKEHAA